MEIILNGDMSADSINEGDWYNNNPTSEIYSIDQMRWLVDGGSFKVRRNSTAEIPGFPHMFEMNCVSPATRSTFSNCHIELPVENMDEYKWGTAQGIPMTVQLIGLLEVGQYSICLMNLDNSYATVVPFTVANRYDWSTTHRVTIPPPPVGSNWASGGKIIFDLGSGDARNVATPGVWQGACWRVAGNNNATDAIGTIMIGGMQADPDPSNGAIAIPFRYKSATEKRNEIASTFFKTMPSGTAAKDGANPGYQGSIGYVSQGMPQGVYVTFPQELRQIPSAANYGALNPCRGGASSGRWAIPNGNIDSGVAQIFCMGTKGVFVHNPEAVPAGVLVMVDFFADARIFGS